MIAEVNADILVVVEVEDRPTLHRFADEVVSEQLQKLGYKNYSYDMVIDGNDDRGIDVGILSRFPITGMRSHITDRTNGKATFSRDCPEDYVELPNGQTLVVLPNHFASKGSDRTGTRRQVQATAVASIYKSLGEGRHVAALLHGIARNVPARNRIRKD